MRPPWEASNRLLRDARLLLRVWNDRTLSRRLQHVVERLSWCYFWPFLGDRDCQNANLVILRQFDGRLLQTESEGRTSFFSDVSRIDMQPEVCKEALGNLR